MKHNYDIFMIYFISAIVFKIKLYNIVNKITTHK